MISGKIPSLLSAVLVAISFAAFSNPDCHAAGTIQARKNDGTFGSVYLARDLQMHLGGIAPLITPLLSSTLAETPRLDASELITTLQKQITAREATPSQMYAGLVLMQAMSRPEHSARVKDFLESFRTSGQPGLDPNADGRHLIAEMEAWSSVLNRDPEAQKSISRARIALHRKLLSNGRLDQATAESLESHFRTLFDGAQTARAAGLPTAGAVFAGHGGVSKSFVRLQHDQAMKGVLADPSLLARVNAMRSSAKPVVTDLSLEAFLPELDGDGQLALGVGGLGFLTGESWGAYQKLSKFHGVGVMPLYAQVSGPKGLKTIDWNSEPGIAPVLVRDKDGRQQPLRFEVEFKGSRKNEVSVYWIDRGGTPVFLLYSPGMFRRLYPGGEEQVIQYGFFARAYVELMKKLDLTPAIVRLNEPQLAFTANAAKNDVDWHNHAGLKSVFDGARFAMTTHTPERAALPSWDVEWLKEHIGADLVRDWEGARELIVDRGGRRIADAAVGLARMSAIVNAVAEEHERVTKTVVLPEFADKIVGIQNGSDPEFWYSDDLWDRVHRAHSLEEISGEELFQIGLEQKRTFNRYLQDHFGAHFQEPDRPLVGLVRRLVEYKEQGMLLPLVQWITGDRDKEYDTPSGRMKGLGMNLLIGGQARDDVGEVWRRQFQTLAQRADLRGRFVFVEGTGIELLRQGAAASDVWVSIPQPTREASGTSDERAGFNGKKNVATATGGPLAYIVEGVTGWLIDIFKDRPFPDVVRRFNEHDQDMINEYRDKGAKALASHLADASRRYYAYTERGEGRWARQMRLAFLIAHREVSIGAMIQKYGLLFESILDGTGAAGFREKTARLRSTQNAGAAFRSPGRS